MKKNLTLFLILFFTVKVFAQSIYVNSTNNYLYRLDINTCTYEELAYVEDQVFDISFHPNGNLYGISSTGKFFQIDTLTGNTNFVFKFDIGQIFQVGQTFNSLTIAANGLVYTIGDDGELWSYDMPNNIETFHGAIGYSATGDLTFFEGNLYAAVTGDRIVLVDIDTPSNSSVIIDENLPGDIYGIVSFAEDCSNVNSYAITDGNSDIYQIDFTSNSLIFICEIDIQVGGGASTYEYFGSSPIVIQNLSEINPSCGLGNGSIQIEATGGTGQIVYSIDGVNFQTSGSFENLSGGSYTMTISDDNNCNVIQEIDLSTPNLPAITSTSPINSTCGNDNGSITIIANGGTGQLTYSIDGINFQISNVFQNLQSGIYSITVIDDNDCTDIEDVEIVLEDSQTITDVSSTNATCGNDNGSITVLANSGTGQLEYSIDGINFQTSNVFQNLQSGIYSITVIDDNDCTDMGNAEILSEDSPTITDVSSTNAMCGNDNGSITVLANSGTGQLEYSVDGINFQVSNTFQNLPSGSYSISVVDQNDCLDNFSAEIQSSDNPTIILIQQSSTTCNQNNGSIEIAGNSGTPPYQYSIDGTNFQMSGIFENLNENEYNLIIQDSVGCMDSILLQIESETPLTFSDIEITQTSCGENNGAITVIVSMGSSVTYSIDGVNFQTQSTFENLVAGDYTVVIQDINDCQVTQNITIEPSELPSQSIVEVPTSCGELNGSIIIDAGGGNLEFSINGNDYQQDNVFLNLAAGSYSVSIKDENDCISINEVEIENSSELLISAIENISAICGESNGGFLFGIEGGSGIIQISLNGGPFQSNFTFENLASGEYDVHIIDEVECVIDTTLIITEEECPIYIPNVFSPNNDGFNDLFKIYPHPDFKGQFKVFRVFNRWGSLVYEVQNFTPEEIGWDGTLKGKNLGIGVYVYFVEYISENGYTEILKGDITIIK